MRTIWLASTALLMSAAFASAQSTPATSPAPTGAITSPAVTPQGTSPGNMGANAAPGASMSMSAPTTNGVSSPAPNGAASAPSVTASNPAAAPGKMAPTPAASSSESAMNTTHPWHHHWMQGGQWSSTSLPADASPSAYLHIAKHAIAHHNIALADDALSHAETRLLDRSVPQGDISADSSPAIQSITSARQALHDGNYSQASADTSQAAGSASGM